MEDRGSIDRSILPKKKRLEISRPASGGIIYKREKSEIDRLWDLFARSISKRTALTQVNRQARVWASLSRALYGSPWCSP